jgi:hypothetical protein
LRDHYYRNAKMSKYCFTVASKSRPTTTSQSCLLPGDSANNFIQQRSAARSKQRDFQERVFLFEMIDSHSALVQSHRRVIDQLPFLLGPSIIFEAGLPCDHDTAGITNNPKSTERRSGASS